MDHVFLIKKKKSANAKAEISTARQQMCATHLNRNAFHVSFKLRLIYLTMLLLSLLLLLFYHHLKQRANTHFYLLPLIRFKLI